MARISSWLRAVLSTLAVLCTSTTRLTVPVAALACRSALAVLPPAARPPAEGGPSVAEAPQALPAPVATPDLPPLGRRSDGLDVFTPEAQLRVTFPAPGVARVRTWPHGSPTPDGSFAVDPAAPGASLYPEAVEEEGDEATVRAGGIALRVNRRTVGFVFLGAGGEPLAEAPDPARFKPDGAGGTLAFVLHPGEHVYGLGDKVKGFDRRGKAFDLWNYDSFGWGKDTDPLYKSSPFLSCSTRGALTEPVPEAPAKGPGLAAWISNPIR